MAFDTALAKKDIASSLQKCFSCRRGVRQSLSSRLLEAICGVLETFGAVYVSYGYRDTFGLLILVVVLLARPQGFFGEQGRVV